MSNNITVDMLETLHGRLRQLEMLQKDMPATPSRREYTATPSRQKYTSAPSRLEHTSKPVEIGPAKRLKLFPMSDLWYFDSEVPHNLQTPGEKIWWIKKEIRYEPSYDEGFYNGKEIQADPTECPDGLRVWETPLEAKKMLSEARIAIAKLFETESKLPHNRQIPSNYDPHHGIYDIFAMPKGKKTLYAEAVKILRGKGHGTLADFCDHYANALCSIYGQNMDAINNMAQLNIMRYDKGKGIWTHLDNIERYDRGPICSISLGPTNMCYDFYPSLHPEKKSGVRLWMNEGNLAVMDGEARMTWSHSIPTETFDQYKYSILLKFDHFTDKIVGVCPKTNLEIFEAPIVNGIILTRQQEMTDHSQAGCQIYKALQILHTRVRKLESVAVCDQVMLRNPGSDV